MNNVEPDRDKGGEMPKPEQATPDTALAKLLGIVNVSIERGDSPAATIAHLIREFGSAEEVMAILEGHPAGREMVVPAGDLLSDLGSVASTRFAEVWTQNYGALVRRLNDIPKWQSLSSDRPAFERELTGTFRSIRKSLKLLCGIRAHRPQANAKRDLAIYKMKQAKPLASFGQIAIEYGRRHKGQKIFPNTAERSYKRQMQRESDALITRLTLLLRPDTLLDLVNPHHKTL